MWNRKSENEPYLELSWDFSQGNAAPQSKSAEIFDACRSLGWPIDIAKMIASMDDVPDSVIDAICRSIDFADNNHQKTDIGSWIDRYMSARKEL